MKLGMIVTLFEFQPVCVLIILLPWYEHGSHADVQAEIDQFW
jgi:hypothetical protein